MDTSEKVQTSVYKLGRISFSVKECNPSFQQELDVLLPHSPYHPGDNVLQISCNNLRDLQNIIFRQHDDCLWLDAGCLIAKDGKKILIVGRSGAGKSTTTMALALSYGWKVVAEDILLIDLKSDQLITFGAPFSLKPGTAELLSDSIGQTPAPILSEEWSPLGGMAAPNFERASFDLSIVFSLSRDAVKPPITCYTLSPNEYVRKCLNASNVLRIQGASEKLLQYIKPGRCFEIKNGTLIERLDKILQLCK